MSSNNTLTFQLERRFSIFKLRKITNTSGRETLVRSVSTHATSSDGEQFVDALTAPLSTIPRSKEEHEELDELNNKFSERLDKMKNKEENNQEIVTSSEEKTSLIKTKNVL
ncbi:uncharacterized protein OCT59_020871 [Rhizophagus irregularis]|uniref:uncharacterized protein n=1 Tax=Rhizophagus irregularis TaxID=588596 RepID=UPI00332CACBF|nr:hypothetical protein OCT59_020871 [Rhizophagus irregularis]